MKLNIDTSSDKITLVLNDKVFTADARTKKAQMLLPLLTDCLAKESANVRDIKQIYVNTGPGSFTGIRVGVSVAMALGWAMNVPVNGELVTPSRFIEINYDSIE